MSLLPQAGIDKGQVLFQGFEGRRLKPYRDTRGIWTIGDGVTTLADGSPVGPNTPPLSVAACDELTRARLYGQFLPGIQRMVRLPLTIDETAALVSLTWNIGLGALESSRILANINVGSMHDAGQNFLLYCHLGNSVFPPLRRRRMAELAVWQADDPPSAMAMVASVHASVAANTADDLNAAELAALQGAQ
jgi:GH24 family phage-related lysozyme (muramidase)